MQEYTYGDIDAAEPYAGEDGSRVISFFIFNTEVHLHAYDAVCREGARRGMPCDPPAQREEAFGSMADPEESFGSFSPSESSQKTLPDGLSSQKPLLDDADDAGRSDVCALDAALLACRDRCRYFEERFSRMRPDSDIARAHAASPAAVAVAPETAELVRLAQGYCERSQGCFDITMGTVTRLWDFHEGIVPSGLALARALPHVGMDKVDVSPVGAPVAELAIADPSTVLDLGGIAKGYIADDLAGILARHGVGRFVINLGGNVLVRGGRPGAPDERPPAAAGSPWKIGIVNPRDPAHYRAIVDVASGSVVTSGLHERRFTKGGVTYHHILNPRDGMPARTDVVSATIVADRSLDCDGYSTTVLMLGVERGLAFAEGLPGVEAVLIDEADGVHWTSGLDERLALVPTLPRW